MKQMLQSVVKIIIIANFFDTATVLGNRQFLPLPPLPYYHNDEYYSPDLNPPYPEPGPVFYSGESVEPPHAFTGYFSPPQLFHHNKNYRPPQEPKPLKNYPFPQVLPFDPDYHPVIPPSLAPQVSTQMHPVQQVPKIHSTQISLEPPKFPPSQIIYKVETVQPYYQDDYIKNYHDDDYSDNYSDDSSVQSGPCEPNSPYRYFTNLRGSLKNPSGNNSDTLIPCSYPPNFYGLKAPLTLLPSRFPPRVEELIERIQNYFSTYTEKETPKPGNLSSTTQPPSSAESVSPVVSTQDTNIESNRPTEQTFTVTIPVSNNVIQVTEEAEVGPNQSEQAKNEQISSTTETDVQNESNSRLDAQNTSTVGGVTGDVSGTTEIIASNETMVNDTNPQKIHPTDVSLSNENSTGQMGTELGQFGESTTVSSIAPESETRVMKTEVMDLTTESAENEHSEEYNSISTTNEVFHKVADNNG